MGSPIMNPTTLLYCAMSDIQWCGMRSIASTPRLNRIDACLDILKGRKALPWLSTRFKLSLLPNRPVVVDSLTLKKAVMHHAEPKQQNKDDKESYESDLYSQQQGCFSLRIGR
jgi:hypothetical protein